MKISFVVVPHTKKTKNPKEIPVSDQYKKCFGNYEVREISAQEGIEAVNILVAARKDFQENPDVIKPEELRKKQIEVATTFNGKPLVVGDLAKFPSKLWQVLVAANEVLNGIGIIEARFLLQPSGQNEKPSIQQ